LRKIIQKLLGEPDFLVERYQREKQGWDIYYDILDYLEKGLQEADAFALELQKKARILVEDCRINFSHHVLETSSSSRE
jgi:hypothetical protein